MGGSVAVATRPSSPSSCDQPRSVPTPAASNCRRVFTTSRQSLLMSETVQLAQLLLDFILLLSQPFLAVTFLRCLVYPRLGGRSSHNRGMTPAASIKSESSAGVMAGAFEFSCRLA